MELHVLVIDDDEIFNLMADIILRDLDFTAHPRCFTNGREAIAYINKHDGPDTCYLLFLDINMPSLSGWEVLNQLQTRPNHHIRVVIVTSSIDRADKEKASRFELVIDYMIKPLERKRLEALKQNKKIASFFS